MLGREIATIDYSPFHGPGAQLQHIRISTNVILTLLFCAFFVAYMHPYVVNGFWDDDAQNSNTVYFAGRFGESIWTFSLRVSQEWLLKYGRIVVSWPYTYGFFALFGDVFWTRVAHVSLILVDIGLSVLLFRLLKFGWKFCLLYGFLVVAQFQLRDMYDPIGALAGLFPTLHILFGISSLLAILYCQYGRRWYLYLCMLPVAISFLAYEINVQFFVVFLACVIVLRRRLNAESLLVFFLSFVAFAVATVWVRHLASANYNGTSVGTVAGFLSTFPAQLFSALPLSYYAGTGFGKPSIALALIGMPWVIGVSAVAFAGLFLIKCLPTGRIDTSSPEWRLAAVISVTQWVVPALLVAISQKYQQIVSFGNGYCLVYYQYFGSAFFLACAMSFLSAGSRARRAVIAVGCIVVGLQFAVNSHIQQRRDAVFKQPREAFEALLKGGFSAVRDGDTLRIAQSFPGVEGNTVFKITGKRVYIPDEHGPDVEYWFPGQSRPYQDGCSFSAAYDNGNWNLRSDGSCNRAARASGRMPPP